MALLPERSGCDSAVPSLFFLDFLTGVAVVPEVLFVRVRVRTDVSLVPGFRTFLRVVVDFDVVDFLVVAV
jgi:hypothetical protein